MLYDIHLPEVNLVKKEGDAATFAIEPLLPGFGLTLGNALRRVILSSLPGAAVTSIRIVGATHEFSTIKDVKEDIVSIVLALKQVRLKSHSDEPVACSLKVSGKKTVKAKDIECPSSVEIMNPDFHIATLTSDKARLNMDIKVEQGRGYDPVENRRGESLETGTILVDALYTPVKKVRYSIENTRVGQMTNLDKLIMEIETDGTMSAEDALKNASDVLVEHFMLVAGKEVPRAASGRVKAGETDRFSNILIEEINLSPRTANALLKSNLKTVGDIRKMPIEELKTLKGFGAKAYDELREKLLELGVELDLGSAEPEAEETTE